MITPEIRHFHSPDADDLARYEPEDGQRFSLLLQMFIGPLGGEGEESFDVEVLTPRWLADRCSDDGRPIPGQHTLIVCAYDWHGIEGYLRNRVAECHGDDWQQVAERIGRFARWEFEDYQE